MSDTEEKSAGFETAAVIGANAGGSAPGEALKHSVGDNIRARRKAVGVSAEALAKAIGVSPATVYRYESGEINKLPVDVLRSVAKELGTTVDELCGSAPAEGEDEVLSGVYFRLAKEAQQANIDPEDIKLAIKTIMEIRNGLQK